MSYPPQQPYQSPVVATTPEPSPSPAKSRTVPILVGVVILLALGVGGLGFALFRQSDDDKPTPAASDAAPTFEVDGTVELKAGQFVTVNDTGCRGYDGFEDLTMGAAVTIIDAAGAVVGVGHINSLSLDGGMQGTCTLSFSVPNVPTGKGFYGVEVSHRSAVKFDEAQLKSGKAELSVG